MNLKKYIENIDPEVLVTGGEFPPPPSKQMLSKVLGWIQFAFMMFIIMGDTLFRILGRPVPAFYENIKQSKWTWGIATFFVGNQIQAGLISTGAFEIYVNDVLEYSKIATGAMPDGDAIQRIMVKYNFA